MSWLSILIRAVLLVSSVCGILLLAERTFPYASLIVFVLSVCMVLTWAILTLLRDRNALRDMFKD